MDPHAVLGLDPGATARDVQRAYRDLAKRFHPDHAGEGAGELMMSINAAYDLLRDQLVEGAEPGPHPTAPDPALAPAADPELQGAWLAPGVRRVLARELLAALEPGELVEEVVLTATADSHDVQLVVTDHRLLWLRDDAIMGRVRSLRLREITEVEARAGGRFRSAGHLRLRTADGRRMRFFELRPDVLSRIAAAIAARDRPAGRGTTFSTHPTTERERHERRNDR
ncbi:J domain-containing protein [Baekduia soli]|uniref:J domain-containing protein n=1 Tax=Baekduia soli TaxID=496014 RepID=A0A5B8U2V5_9ACTN|nr:J domain-containing protein [Baekduia soli]QEC47356.1 J domain-containing protein [Baekduia soli]